MPTFSNIDGEESATVTFTVGAISLTRNSSAELQEILCLGDPEVASSLGLARVIAGVPDSSHAGLVVRQVGHSTTVQVSSVGGAVVVRSSAADFAATVQPASTVWAVQVDGRVRAQNSTIGDLLASVQQNSTVWETQAALRTSSGGGLEGSTAMPVNGVLGLNVRQVFPTIRSTGRSTAGNNSTSLELVSSVAAQRVKVFAYSITSTMNGGAANDVGFYSSAAHLLWPIVLRAISSGVTGANLAVSPPAWLFATEVANALNFNVTGSTGTYKVGISYFQEA